MDKKQFLQALESHLRGLSSSEKQEIINDYEEYFLFAEEEGKTEEEIALALGDPRQLAKELTASHHIGRAEVSSTAGNLFRAIWSVIGLGFVNLVIVLAPFLVVAALLFAGWTIGIAGIASPPLVLISAVGVPGTFEWFDLFTSFVFCGAGYFITLLMWRLTPLFFNGVLRYLKFNVKIVKGGMHHA